MQQQISGPPGVIISALRGGSGKTLISIGIIAAWNKLKKKIAPFKKGPDYIDAGWLSLAAGRPCYNLDTFLIQEENILKSFTCHSLNADFVVIEGNRGLYDGIDSKGSTCTAELAKLLGLPVILCIDCTKSTRTMAAAVLGCARFDPDVNIKGIILNKVAGSRHEKILQKTIEAYCNIPVVGALPKINENIFPERHMGLVPTPEHTWAADSIDKAAQIAESYINFDALTGIATSGINHLRLKSLCPDAPLTVALNDRISKTESSEIKVQPAPLIGIFKDSAFQFYYPENIEALKLAGAKTVFISPLKDDEFPDVDALYIGGGFPETHAKKLANNKIFLDKLKKLAMAGLPIYAECGGLMFLGKEIVVEGIAYKMAGILPISFGLSAKPQGHGYTIALVEKKNPFFKVGTILKGHEFHYSKVLKYDGNDYEMIFSMKRGTGLTDKRDGVCIKNVLATYIHIHALGIPEWAESMVSKAREYIKYI